ncbi:MAG: hypothetical protein GF349_03215 [Candidatus Magasanikbacteria bacterium]|nr:hypothetical protein [Candidatus Magasanikbacteria bacterium]
MFYIDKFIRNHSDLFRFMKAEEVHIHDKLLYKGLLQYFPESITPNKISIFRIIATPVVFLIIVFGSYKIGIVFFLLVASTDAIDGSLARTKNKITQFGKLIDPLADKFLVGSMVILLVFENFSFVLGVTILIIEIVFIFSALVAKYKFKTVRMANVWGKIKMILQVTAVFVTLLALLLEFPLLLTIAAWIFGIAIGFAIISLFAHGI